MFDVVASNSGTASRGCTWIRRAAALAPLLLAACAAGPGPQLAASVYTAPAPSAEERYCAWFGDVDGSVLYFGESAFWSAYRAAGNQPTAVLAHAGPARIGRFDLAAERFLAPLDVTLPEDRSGVWDVLAHPNGRIYFTTYFGTSGYVDPKSGEQRRFEDAGRGLNELALGPEGRILVTRYGPRDGRAAGGSVVLLDEDGQVLAEHRLTAPSGYRAAPKTVAFDPEAERIWVTTDGLGVGENAGAPARHDAYVLDANGGELLRVADPEIQFVAFAPDGTGYRAEVQGDRLWLRIAPPESAGAQVDELRVPLEHAFAIGADFVQDIQFATDGRAVLTRWSGWVHVVDDSGRIRSLRLPPLEEGGLYYTAGLRNGRICASYCGEVSVVCRLLDPTP